MPSRTLAESALNNSSTPNRQLPRCRFSFDQVRVVYRLLSTNTELPGSSAAPLQSTFGHTTRSVRTRRLTTKRRTMSITRHSAVQQPTPPALTGLRWPVDFFGGVGAAESEHSIPSHAAGHCNRPAKTGQGSSTRRQRAAAWSHVAGFFWRDTTESELTLLTFTHFSQTVVLTRGPP